MSRFTKTKATEHTLDDVQEEDNVFQRSVLIIKHEPTKPLISKLNSATHYFVSIWFLSAALLTPEAKENLSFGSIVAPYLFMVALLAWSSITLTWLIYTAIQRSFFATCRQAVYRFVSWLSSELYELRDSYVAKTVLGILFGLTCILSFDWLYYHFDIWYTIRSVTEFLHRAWIALFNVHELAKVIHDWVNKIFLNWLVEAIGCVLGALRYIVRYHPLLGLLSIAVVVIVTMAVLICAKNAKSTPAAATA